MLREVKEDMKMVRENWVKVILSNRGFHALLAYRVSHLLWKAKVPMLPLIITRIIQILYGIDIDWRAKIAGGCLIVHGMGVVIGRGVVIGKNAKIFHGVTLGIRDDGKDNDGFPVVGDNVFIGCGAKLLGNIHVGDNAKIGANAVVIDDVPPSHTAVGIPAKIIRKQGTEAL